MKSLFLGIFLTILIFFSCKKESNNTVDITGIWLGTYMHDSETGTFRANVTQNGAIFRGFLSVKYDGETGNSYSSEINGTINNDILYSHFNFSFVNIDVKSNKLKNDVADGVFSTNINIAGTWKGTKISSKEASLTKVFSVKGMLLESCALADNNIWISNFFDKKIYKIDTSGNINGILQLNTSYRNFCYDGQLLWLSTYSDGIQISDTLGNILNTYKYYGLNNGIISYCNNYLWFFNDNSKKLYKLNKDCEKLDSISFPYFDIGRVDYHSGCYYLYDSYLKAIIKTDSNFKNPEAYTMQFEGSYQGQQVFIGNQLWFIINVYSGSNSANPMPEAPGFNETINFYKLN